MVEKGHFAELQNLLEMLNTSQFNPSRQTFGVLGHADAGARPAGTPAAEEAQEKRAQQTAAPHGEGGHQRQAQSHRPDAQTGHGGDADGDAHQLQQGGEGSVAVLLSSAVSRPQHGVRQQHRLHQASECAAADPGLCSSAAAR